MGNASSSSGSDPAFFDAVHCDEHDDASPSSFLIQSEHKPLSEREQGDNDDDHCDGERSPLSVAVVSPPAPPPPPPLRSCSSASSSSASSSSLWNMEEWGDCHQYYLSPPQCRRTDVVAPAAPPPPTQGGRGDYYHDSDDEEDSYDDDEAFGCIWAPSFLYNRANPPPPDDDGGGSRKRPRSARRRHQRSLSFGSCSGYVRDNYDDDGGAASKDGGGGKRGLLGSFASSLSSLEREYTDDELDMDGGDEPSYESDLRPAHRGGRHRDYYVVTTAALPWMTGTAVNPLLRAGYLHKMNDRPSDLGENDGEDEQVWKDASTTTDDSSAVTATTDRETCSSDNDDDWAVGGDGISANLPSDIVSTSSDDKTRSVVTLVVPWLECEEDRSSLYGLSFAFKDPSDQEVYIRSWLREKARLPHQADEETGIRILWYPARYHKGLNSIFAMGDICKLIPNDKADICILEEPEHLNWYRAPGSSSWTNKFQHVVGVVHTNYKAYVSNHISGVVVSPLLGVLSSLMVQAYCHRVVKLSDVLQSFAPEKECVSNVHGIRSEFLLEGRRRAAALIRNGGATNLASARSPQCYWIGKLLWAKGLDKMIDLQEYYRRTCGSYFDIDIYGSGPEEVEIKRAFLGREKQAGVALLSDDSLPAPTHKKLKVDIPKSRFELRRMPIPSRFLGRKDHAALGEYKVFVNPSLTEVLCTTTAEAIAMGKWCCIPAHPSNDFFAQFPNCLQYKSKAEFVSLLNLALTTDPPSLTEVQGYQLTWEAATERCIEASRITRRDARRRERLGKEKGDERIAKALKKVLGGKRGDVVRKVMGAGSVADQVQYEMGTGLGPREAVEGSF